MEMNELNQQLYEHISLGVTEYWYRYISVKYTPAL